jgi:hypothetical protein
MPTEKVIRNSRIICLTPADEIDKWLIDVK